MRKVRWVNWVRRVETNINQFIQAMWGKPLPSLRRKDSRVRVTLDDQKWFARQHVKLKIKRNPGIAAQFAGVMVFTIAPLPEKSPTALSQVAWFLGKPLRLGRCNGMNGRSDLRESIWCDCDSLTLEEGRNQYQSVHPSNVRKASSIP